MPPLQALSTEAERRQLTVMFCDLVDSTVLSERLDPEDLREVIVAYQACCEAVIEQFDGYVARYMGDGMLVYFGYPQATEYDPERAVRAGLGIVAAMGGLRERTGIKLQTRVGIATGGVVVGDVVGKGFSREEAVVGKTPNLAARLQGIAAPDSVVIAASTHRLIGPLFDYRDLGHHSLKGFEQSVPAWQALAERAVAGRFEATHAATDLIPLVGRDAEIELVLRRWPTACAGKGQVVLITGEAGIGKSRLLQALRDEIKEDPHTVIRYYGAPHSQNSVYYPVIDQLKRGAKLDAADTPDQKLAKLEKLLVLSGRPVEDDAPLFASLLAIPTGDRYAPLEMSPAEQKHRTFEAGLGQITGLAQRQPVLLSMEDAHWIDPTTLEFVDLLVKCANSFPIYLIITYRPDFTPVWTDDSYVTTVVINRLSREQGRSMATRVAAGKTLPEEILEQILTKTDGVPLFVEELTKTVLESGLLEEREDRYVLNGPLPPFAVPDTLHDSLMARLDRLSSVKDVAQIGAVIGREFSFELITAVSSFEPQDVASALDKLVAAELVFQHGTPPHSSYVFKHALVQDTSYESLLRDRRRKLHQRIAEVIEERFQHLINTQPELLAHHYTEATLYAESIKYWREASRVALERFAHKEVIAHLRKGLDGLQKLPRTSHLTQQELAMYAALGPALMVARGPGHPEVGQAYEFAHELCQALENPPQSFPVLFGLCLFHWASGQLRLAEGEAKELLAQAERSGEDGHRLAAHTLAALSLWHMGENDATVDHLDTVINIYNPEIHPALFFTYLMEFGVFGRFYSAFGHFVRGYPDETQRFAGEALTLARRLNQPHAIGFGLLANFMTSTMRGDVDSASRFAAECIPFATEQGFPEFVALAMVSRGWATVKRGQVAAGIADMEEGSERWEATGFNAWRPWLRALLADVYVAADRFDDALNMVEQGLDLIDRQDERQFESLLLAAKADALCGTNVANAEKCYHQALDIARNQGAISWELHVALRLANRLKTRGESVRVRELLAPLCDRFPQDASYFDLDEARSLLSNLAD